MKSFILFLVNPFIGFLSSIRDLKRFLNGFVFAAFYSLFGYAISFSLTTADSYRIGARFCQQDFSSESVWQMYQEGALTDVYLIGVFSILKPFTSNPKVLFGVLGAVMGVFAYLAISQLYDLWKEKKTRYFYVMLLFFFLPISFLNVNGIRFWTATAFFSYFAIQYLYFGKRLAFFAIAITPLIHFGFIIGAGAFYLFSILKKFHLPTLLYYICLLLAFAATQLSTQNVLDDIITEDGDVGELSSNRAIQNKERNYYRISVNEAKQAERQSRDTSLYRQANRVFTRTCEIINNWGMILMLSLLYFKRRSIMQSKRQAVFFKYVLFSFIVGHLASVVVISGARFIRLANLMYIFWLLSVFQQNYSRRWKDYVLCLIPLNLYILAFIFFNAPRLVTPLLWFAPPIITILDGIGFGPIDFVN